MTRHSAPHLAWNVKSTFRTYVEQSGGLIEVAHSATQRPDAFLFPMDTRHRDPTASVYRFVGAVRFLGHGGALDLVIRDPWLHLEDGARKVSVEGTESTRTSGQRLLLAELDPITPERSHDPLVGVDVPATLAESGAVVFDFRYPVGAELAPVSFFISS